MKLQAALLTAFMLGAPMLGACQVVGERSDTLPATPAQVKRILAARRFTLETPYMHASGERRVSTSTGVLVVLEVDPAYVIPRETLEPVLYAGNAVVLRLNHGHRSGRVIGIAPGDVDLADAPIWFGAPELPERVTASMISAQRALAQEAGVRTFSQASVTAARRPAITAKDLAALLRTAGADLVYEFSPQEKELADSWRLPVAEAPTRKQAD